MTKKEIILFARARGYEPRYSGKDGRFYFHKLSYIFRGIKPINIHELINSKESK
jgi:hypothetical protein